MLQRPFRSPLSIAVLFLGVVFSAAAPRVALAQDQGAVSFIQYHGSQALQQLAGPAPQRVAYFRQLFATNFDLPEISRFVLGQYGRMLPPQEQQEFASLFQDYIAKSSVRLAPYAGAQFRVTGARPYGGATVVTSQAFSPGSNQPIGIDWQVVNQGGRYLVTDVIVGGVSMKVSLRDEFASIIQRNGGRPEALLAVMRQQRG